MYIPHKYAEVIKAWADGKPVQYKTNDEGDWKDFDYPHAYPAWNNHEWRVKPEKKIAWINVYNNSCSDIYFDRQSADAGAGVIHNRIACIQIEYEEGQGL